MFGRKCVDLNNPVLRPSSARRVIGASSLLHLEVDAVIQHGNEAQPSVLCLCHDHVIIKQYSWRVHHGEAVPAKLVFEDALAAREGEIEHSSNKKTLRAVVNGVMTIGMNRGRRAPHVGL